MRKTEETASAARSTTTKGVKATDEPGDFTTTWRLVPIFFARHRHWRGLRICRPCVASQEDRDAALKRSLGGLVRPDAVEAYPDEPLQVVVYRMADKGFTRMLWWNEPRGSFSGEWR